MSLTQFPMTVLRFLVFLRYFPLTRENYTLHIYAIFHLAPIPSLPSARRVWVENVGGKSLDLEFGAMKVI